MSEKKVVKCEYKECYLPENNNKYGWQFAYLLLSGLFLISDSTEFTFFSLLMFTVPIILDVQSSKFPSSLFNGINKFFLVLNISIGIFCLAGMVGVFVDEGTRFVFAENSLAFPGAGFEKKFFLIPLIIDLFIPIMMYNGSPSKQTKWIIEQSREQRKVGST